MHPTRDVFTINSERANCEYVIPVDELYLSSSAAVLQREIMCLTECCKL